MSKYTPCISIDCINRFDLYHIVLAQLKVPTLLHVAWEPLTGLIRTKARTIHLQATTVVASGKFKSAEGLCRVLMMPT